VTLPPVPSRPHRLLRTAAAHSRKRHRRDGSLARFSTDRLRGTDACAPPDTLSGSEVDAAALVARQTDQLAQALLAVWTHGISPVAISLAFGDWMMHLLSSPGKQVELARKWSRKSLRYAWFLARLFQGEDCPACIEAPSLAGSWWPLWVKWLTERSGRHRRPPPMGRPDRGYPVLCDAPGSSVHQR